MRQHLLAKVTLSAAVLSASLVCGAVPAPADNASRWATPSAWRATLPHHKAAGSTDYKVRQAKASAHDRALAAMRFQGQAAAPGISLQGLATGKPDHTLEAGNNFGYLDAPDGTTWFYTGGPVVEEVKHEYYTDRIITGYDYTVYDSKFKRVGSISDKITLQGNETKVASIGIDAAITSKFFNSQSNYEVMVVLFLNNPDYSVTTRTAVYTLDGARDDEGNSTMIASYTGKPVDAVNMAADKWSEDFFITFRDEILPDPDDFEEYVDYLQACAYKLTVYKKGGWSGAPVKVLEYSIPQPQLPGDVMSSPYFMATKTAGKPTFTIWHYAKPFFDNPIAEEPMPTADNSLEIHTFSMPSVSSSEATPQHTTSVATVPHTGSKILYTFYSIGLTGYTEDVLTGDFGGTPEAPSYIVTTEDYTISDDDNYIYGIYAYDNSGALIKTIAENAYGFVALTTPAGAHRQTAVIYNDEFGYSFRIMDLTDGEEVTSFEQVLDRETLTASLDRVRVNGRDLYASAVNQADVEADGTVYTKVAWINTEGRIDRVDRIPLGKEVAMSSLNITGAMLTPYVFDTDDEVEYMALVKRRTGAGTETQEELLITAPSGVMLTITPDDQLGTLTNIAVVNLTTAPQLMIVYNNGQYTQTFYDLPLTKFAGGDGTEANPYLIASAADLQQMKSNPAAYYTLSKDFDAQGFPFDPVEAFSGVLDGAGHTISNFTLDNDRAFVGLLSNTGLTAVVKNLNFLDPVIRLNSNSTQAGLIAASAPGIKVSNVHVYGLTASDSEESRAEAIFGGLVADATSTASISQCFVAGARIDLPESSSVGGIVGRGRTGISVRACAFTGSINGATEIGGIAGTLDTGDETIADCHVDADLTAQNTVGGIAGSTNRSILTRNYAEGSVTATTPGRWTKALAAGGIVGSMTTEYDPDSKDIVKVSHNVVALSAINVPALDGTPEYPGQFNTVHRIAGRTGLNEAPEIVDYDADDNPVYDPNFTAYEGGLSENYSVDALAPVEETAATHKGSDGQSMDLYEIGYDFLTQHGYKYGTDLENPWNPATGYDPALHFETGIIINPSDIQATEGQTFNVDIHINGRRQLEESELMDDFMCEYDTEHIEMTGNYTFDGKTFSIEFTCLKPGVSQLAVKMLGSTALATVTGVSGIDDIVAAAPSLLSYDGKTVSAEGCAISLYAVSGVKAAQGVGSLDVAALPAGVYVAVATASDGTRSQMKILVK